LLILKKALHYYHTLRYLKPIQIYGRIFSSLRRKIGLSKLPPVPQNLSPFLPRRTVFLFHEPWNNSESLQNNQFNFLNKSIDFGEKILWNDQNVSLLWKFNLHYMNYLFLLSDKARKELVLNWIDNNPVSQGTSWYPFVLSLRLINLCKIGFEDKSINESLYIQAAYLFRNTEYYHPANHYLENARALIFAGLYFGQLGESKNWFQKGLSIIKEQLPTQVLEDGGYFEKSMMYHAIILEGFLDLINILPESESLRTQLIKSSEKMLKFLVASTHPDGNIALFNDSTEEFAPPTEKIINYAAKLGLYPVTKSFQSTNFTRRGGQSINHSFNYSSIQSSNHSFFQSFPQTGFHIYKDEQIYLIIDAGSIGPDNIPAHSHADIFSYELSLLNEKMIVDSGVYEYETGEMRNYARSTKAHNTLTIDGKDQAEYWGSFRVARRYSPKNIICEENNNAIVISAEFDGYSKLIGNSLNHKRVFNIQKKNKIVEIIDTVSGKGNHLSESRIHLHPLCTVDIKTDLGNTVLIVKKDKIEMNILISASEYRIEEGWYCPQFGIKEKNKVIVIYGQSVPSSLVYSIHY